MQRRRLLLLVPAASLAVHQLRYSLAYGAHAGSELAAQGHSYLHSLVPWMVLALAVAASLFLRDLVAAARSGRVAGVGASAPAQWALSTALLIGVYVVQELLEGLFAAGHPAGAAGVLGHGGWWALPAAAAAALVVVVVLRLGRIALTAVAGRAPRRRRLAGTAPLLLAPLQPSARPAPLARSAAGRAPPAAA